jgi:hypothetical protein
MRQTGAHPESFDHSRYTSTVAATIPRNARIVITVYTSERGFTDGDLVARGDDDDD